MERRGAAGIVIGNEVLTGKVEEANGSLLVRRLRAHGVPLLGLQVVPDEVDAIVEAVALARRRARWLFTSGGIGPTHDDVTVRAVALALGRRVVRPPEAVAMVRSWWKGAEPPAEALRFADVPEGATLLQSGEAKFPVIACDGVFLLPGVPALFATHLETVLATLPRGRLAMRVLYLSAGEPEIARSLDAVALAMPHVAIGSYPAVERGGPWRVKLTVEHEDDGPVAEAVQRLEAELPRGCIIAVE